MKKSCVEAVEKNHNSNEGLPVVSIVVPTRNRVEWLQRCLDRIAEQTFSDYEVLVVDDGSSKDVVKAYNELLVSYGSNFSLILANKSGDRSMGPSLIRNIGLAASRGTFIAFCDDDDYWCSTKYLAVAISSLEATDADLFFANQKILRGKEIVASSTFSNVEAALKEQQKLPDISVYEVSRKQILVFPDYAHLNITIARRSLLENVGGFWEETRYAEDVDLFVRLSSAAKKILFFPTVCSVHNSPIANDRESASKSVLEIDRRLLENLVYWHLLATCDTPEAVRYATLSLSSNSKLLCRDIESYGSSKAVLVVARIALATKMTFKWAAYSLWLHIKSVLKRT